ncbi:hypothetical protein [Nicoliella lavandulae]|uniref:Uncharacterized protein n=1 Tax=Nicoliella lavandulae TaxID=3082954 RepID=A0ABU8SLJ3_9LACO
MGILIAIIIYNLVHRLFVVNPTKREQLAAENHCRNVLINLIDQMPHSNYNFDIIGSKVLSEVWGRGIQVFEFKLAADDEKVSDKLTFIKEHLVSELASRNRKQAHNDAEIQITDLWQYDQFIHVEVAYLTNQSTREYINDINRLTE